MFVVAGCSGPLPNAVPLPLARSSPPVSHHLLHLPEIQPGMENPHPQPIYTSSLTSPGLADSLTFLKVEPVMVVSRPSTFNPQLTRPAAAFEIKRKGGNHHGQNAGSGF